MGQHAPAVQHLLAQAAQRHADPVAGEGGADVVVHDLQAAGHAGVTGRQHLDVIVLGDGARLDVADGDQSYALDVEVLVHRQHQRGCLEGRALVGGRGLELVQRLPEGVLVELTLVHGPIAQAGLL